MYEIIWQVQTDNPWLARKDCRSGKPRLEGACTLQDIMVNFHKPEIIDTGKELVIWQDMPDGSLAAEGWRKLGRAS